MQNVENKNKDFYERKWEEQWNLARQYYGPGFYHRKRLVRRIIKNNSLSGKILDIGCGDGSLLSLFRGNKNKLYGCDISEKAIQLAKKKFGDIATFSTGDIADLNSLIDEKFDVVICCEVLEHIENDELIIKNLHHKLNEGGYLIISVPHMRKYWTKSDELDGHVRRYEKNELENKIVENGFMVCESWTWGYPLSHIYNKIVLKNVQKQTMVKVVKRAKLKQILSIILSLIFYFDDFFIFTLKGRALFVLAKKIN